MVQLGEKSVGFWDFILKTKSGNFIKFYLVFKIPAGWPEQWRVDVEPLISVWVATWVLLVPTVRLGLNTAACSAPVQQRASLETTKLSSLVCTNLLDCLEYTVSPWQIQQLYSRQILWQSAQKQLVCLVIFVELFKKLYLKLPATKNKKNKLYFVYAYSSPDFCDHNFIYMSTMNTSAWGEKKVIWLKVSFSCFFLVLIVMLLIERNMSRKSMLILYCYCQPVSCAETDTGNTSLIPIPLSVLLVGPILHSSSIPYVLIDSWLPFCLQTVAASCLLALLSKSGPLVSSPSQG